MSSKPEGPFGDRSLDGYIWRDDLTGSRYGPFAIYGRSGSRLWCFLRISLVSLTAREDSITTHSH